MFQGDKHSKYYWYKIKFSTLYFILDIVIQYLYYYWQGITYYSLYKRILYIKSLVKISCNIHSLSRIYCISYIRIFRTIVIKIVKFLICFCIVRYS